MFLNFEIVVSLAAGARSGAIGAFAIRGAVAFVAAICARANFNDGDLGDLLWMESRALR